MGCDRGWQRIYSGVEMEADKAKGRRRRITCLSTIRFLALDIKKGGS